MVGKETPEIMGVGGRKALWTMVRTLVLMLRLLGSDRKALTLILIGYLYVGEQM